MAWSGEGVWFNQYTNEVEVVNGVYCDCWDCTFMIPTDQLIDGGVFFTKSEYNDHKEKRRRAYFDRKELLRAAKDGMARTKEQTEMEAIYFLSVAQKLFDIGTLLKRFKHWTT